MASTDYNKKYQEELGQSHLARVTTQAVRRNLEAELDELKARIAADLGGLISGIAAQMDELSGRLAKLEQVYIPGASGTKQ